MKKFIVPVKNVKNANAFSTEEAIADIKINEYQEKSSQNRETSVGQEVVDTNVVEEAVEVKEPKRQTPIKNNKDIIVQNDKPKKIEVPQPEDVKEMLMTKMPVARPMLEKSIESVVEQEEEEVVEQPKVHKKPVPAGILRNSAEKPVVEKKEEKATLQMIFELNLLKAMTTDDRQTFENFVGDLTEAYSEDQLQFVIDNKDYLMMCSRTNCVNVFQYIAELGFIDITAENLFNEAVIECCAKGSLDMLNVLIEMGKASNLQEPDMRYGAKVSTFHEQTNILQWIMENVEKAKEERFWQPLIESAKKYNNSTLQWYQETFADQMTN